MIKWVTKMWEEWVMVMEQEEKRLRREWKWTTVFMKEEDIVMDQDQDYVFFNNYY